MAMFAGFMGILLALASIYLSWSLLTGSALKQNKKK